MPCEAFLLCVHPTCVQHNRHPQKLELDRIRQTPDSFVSLPLPGFGVQEDLQDLNLLEECLSTICGCQLRGMRDVCRHRILYHIVRNKEVQVHACHRQYLLNGHEVYLQAYCSPRHTCLWLPTNRQCFGRTNGIGIAGVFRY